MSPEITKAIYRAIGEKGHKWSTGMKMAGDYKEWTVGELTDPENGVDRDNCTWDLKLMELKCHKDILFPMQRAIRSEQDERDVQQIVPLHHTRTFEEDISIHITTERSESDFQATLHGNHFFELQLSTFFELQSNSWRWAVFVGKPFYRRVNGYFRTLDVNTAQTGFNVEHLKMLAIVLNHPETKLYLDSKTENIGIEMGEQAYVVDCYDKDGDRIILVTSPFHALFFPDFDHHSITWRRFNDAERCFEPFFDDPLLYSELNASFFANRMCSTSMFQSLYMPRLSELSQKDSIIQYSQKHEVVDIISLYHSTRVSVIRGCQQER